jgi:lysozyme family protein
MADFYKIVAPTLKFEGGYGNRPDDPGNYCTVWRNGKAYRGALVGTNHGIAAPTLQTYLGRCPTVAEMKALTKEKAIEIYKKIFWDGLINGDKIKDQYVAFMCFQAVIGAMTNLRIVRRSINKLSTGKKVVESATPFNNYTTDIINSITPKKLFTQMYDDYWAHLKAVDAAIYKGTVPGWYIRMETIKKWAMAGYNTVKENPKTTAGVAFFLSQQDCLDTDYHAQEKPLPPDESVA